jgi:hypothetical protein
VSPQRDARHLGSLVYVTLPSRTVLASWLSYLIAGQANVVIAVGLASMDVRLPLLIAVAVTRPHLFDVDQVLQPGIGRRDSDDNALTCANVLPRNVPRPMNIL